MRRLGGSARAAVGDDDPFLFQRRGHDWRWLSMAEVEARLSLPAADLPEWSSDPTAAALRALAESPALDRLRHLLERLPPSERRDILVLDRPPAEAAGSLLLAWAAETGAAVLLEPQRERAAATVAWARPTLVAGSAAELAAIGERLLGLGSPARLRRRRGPLGRVRAVVLIDSPAGELPEPWASLGVPAISLE